MPVKPYKTDVCCPGCDRMLWSNGMTMFCNWESCAFFMPLARPEKIKKDKPKPISPILEDLFENFHKNKK